MMKFWSCWGYIYFSIHNLLNEGDDPDGRIKGERTCSRDGVCIEDHRIQISTANVICSRKQMDMWELCTELTCFEGPLL